MLTKGPQRAHPKPLRGRLTFGRIRTRPPLNDDFHAQSPRNPVRNVSTFATASGWELWALITGSAVLGNHLSTLPLFMIRLGLSAPVLIMSTSWVLASLHILPTACAAYDLIWTKLVPLAASLLLLETDLTGVARVGWTTLLAFLLGAVGTLLGTWAAWHLCGHLFHTDGHFRKIAAALCASYIGGSVNFAAVVASTQLLDRTLIAAATTADNFVMAIYLTVLTLWKVPEGARTSVSATAGQPQPRPTVGSPAIEARHILQSLAAATASVSLGSLLAAALHAPMFALALASLVAAFIGAAFQRLVPGQNPFAGARDTLGSAVMALFFVTVGASAACSLGTATTTTLALLLFIAIQLACHLLWTLGVGRLVLRLPMRELLVASNANIGGPATAAAMCNARGWNDLVAPAILSGCLGYAVGTGLALALPLK